MAIRANVRSDPATSSPALLAYGPSLRDMHRQAAVYVDKILKGETGVARGQPTKYQLVNNLKLLRR